jgi:CheY-like chemotaxis protein
MPIEAVWDPRNQVVRAHFARTITLIEVAAYENTLVERGWLAHAQLIDARWAVLSLSPEDVRIFSELMTGLHREHGRAPIAFVTGNDFNDCVASMYQDLGAGANPDFAMFPDVATAEAWLFSRGPNRTGRPLRPTVLVVDDVEPVRRVIARALELAGYEVLSTSGPMEALALIWEAGGTIELAVVDLNLEAMGGETLAAALRRLRPELKVLFVSGDDTPDRTEEGPLLAKPFDQGALARCVGQYLATGCCDDCQPLVSLRSSA